MVLLYSYSLQRQQLLFYVALLCFYFIKGVANSGGNDSELRLLCNLPEIQWTGLQDFYNDLNGEHWLWKSSPATGARWNFTGGYAAVSVYPANNPCDGDWHGIGCAYADSTTSNSSSPCWVTSIVLYSFNLSGQLPHNFGNSFNATLTELSVYNNSIHGSLPESLGNLSMLQILQVNSNKLHGTIPDSVVNMSLLEQFLVLENYLTGSIPHDIGIGCSHLTQFNIQNNFITGTIPNSMTYLSNLQGLYLYSNLLTGSLPAAFGNLQQLLVFQCSNNLLTGSIPESMTNCSLLQQISAYNNHFTGKLPDTFGDQFQDMTSINIRNNFLNGGLSDSLFNMINLQQLYMSVNLFAGSISSSIGNLQSMVDIWLYQNIFTGSIPSTITSLTRLYTCLLHTNAFTGTIPVSLGNMINLQQIQWYENYFNGSIPDSIGKLPLLFQLSLDVNELTGMLPSSLHNLSQLEIFTVSNNKLTGSLEQVFNDQTSFPYLGEIQLGLNAFTGSIPNQIFSSSLQFFGASINCFDGDLPSTICNADRLLQLELNGLSCAAACRQNIFPAFTGIQTYILTEDHKVTGTIPLCVFSMPVLEAAYLSGNGLTAKLTDDSVSFVSSSLINISLSHNIITGVIPVSIQQHPSWQTLDLSYNLLAGSLHSSFFAASNSNISSLTLDVNNLSGDLPQSVLSLQTISILSGNIFGCGVNKVQSLPVHDPDYTHYQCGSNFLDGVLYLWLGLVLATCVPVLLCFVFNGSSSGRERPDLTNSGGEQFSLTAYCEHIHNKIFVDALTSFTDNSNEDDDDEIGYIGQQFQSFRRRSTCLVILIICCVLPIYGILRAYFSSHAVLYAWTLSGMYLIGVTPAVVLCLVFVGVFIYIAWFFFATSDREVFQEVHASVTKKNLLARQSIDHDVGAPRSSSILPLHVRRNEKEMNRVEAGKDDSPQPCRSDDISVMSQQSTVVMMMMTTANPLLQNNQHKLGPSHHVTATASAASDNNNREEVKQEESPSSPPQQSPSLSSLKATSEATTTRRFYYRTAILLLNIIIVIAVNVCFIYIYLYKAAQIAALVTILLAIFKIVWTQQIFFALNQQGGAAASLLIVGSPTDMISSSSASSSCWMAILLLLLNNILLPLFTMVFINADCFYNAFIPAPDIQVTFTQARGDFCNAVDCFSKNGYSTDTTYFTPAYSYSYQCTAAVITAYAPVFTIVFLLDAFVRPIVSISVLLCLKYYRSSQAAATADAALSADDENSSSNNAVSSDSSGERKQQHDEVIISVDDDLSDILQLYPNHNHHAAANDDEHTTSAKLSWKQWIWTKILLDKITNPVVDANGIQMNVSFYILSVTNQLIVLLTWGVIFPCLAPVIWLAMISRSYHMQVGLGRALQASKALKLNNYRLLLSMQSLEIFAHLQQLLYPVVVITAIFYSILIFDTLQGDDDNLTAWMCMIIPCVGLIVCVLHYYYSSTVAVCCKYVVEATTKFLRWNYRGRSDGDGGNNHNNGGGDIGRASEVELGGSHSMSSLS